MTRKAQRFKPEAIVKIYTEQGEFVSRSRPDKEGSAVDAEVLSISTNNDMSSDSGVFSITMVARKRWDITISPNDLVIIYMKRDPKDDEAKSCVFFGLVDSTEYMYTTEGNQAKRQVSVSGRSFAKAFINFEIGAVTDTGLPGASIGWLRGKINFTGQSAADIVKQIIDVLGSHIDYEFSNKKTLLQYMDLDKPEKIYKKPHPYINSRDGGLLNEQTFINFEGTLYNFLKSVVDEPFNQMYFEVLEGAPRLIVRETPFNEDKWKQLKCWTVEEKDVVTMQIGRNDLETYSLYSVGITDLFNIFGSQGTLGNRPLVYAPYLKKYGIRRMHRYSNYLGNKVKTQNQPQSPENIQPNLQQTAYADSIGAQMDLLAQNQQDQNNQAIVTKAKQYAADLYNWYVKNPEFYSGTLTVRGENHYKVGDRLLLVTSDLTPEGKTEKQEIEFFIEGVAHEFINFKHWRTTLSVTRGLPNAGKERFSGFLPPDKIPEYQGGAVGDPTLPELKQLAYENQQMILMQLGFVTPVGSAPTFGTGASSATQQVAQYYLNPPFRPQHNFGENRGNHIHKGEDLAAPTGTKIYALFDGTVTKNAYQAGGAGNYVVINHPNGYVTKYFHMRERSFLPKGAKVKAGDLIGYVGATGDAKGSHLHLEIWVNGKVQNPLPILEQLAGYTSSGGITGGGWV